MGNISLSSAKAQLDGLVMGQDHVDYDLYRRTWNGLVDRRPGAIVRASNIIDVTKTVKMAADHHNIGYFQDAKSNICPQ